METLELKDLCKYLPYTLMITSGNDVKPLKGIEYDSKLIHFGFDENDWFNNLGFIKPIFRPLSQLTDEIKHNGMKIIPAIEIAKMCDNGHNYNDSMARVYNGLIWVSTGKVDDVEDVRILFDDKGIKEVKRLGENIMFVTFSKIQNFLIELHFWIGDQSYFDKGIIIKK